LAILQKWRASLDLPDEESYDDTMSSERPYYWRWAPAAQQERDYLSDGTHVDLTNAHMAPYGTPDPVAVARSLFDRRGAMALGPAVPDPPLNSVVSAPQTRHRIGDCFVVLAKSVLGGLHHEYSLLGVAP
jgi:hypothetical protein